MYSFVRNQFEKTKIVDAIKIVVDTTTFLNNAEKTPTSKTVMVVVLFIV